MTEASKLRPRRDDEPTPEKSAGEEQPAGEATAVDLQKPAGSQDAAATEAGPAEEADAPTQDDDVDALADGEDRAYKKELRKGLLVGIGAGVIGGLIVSLVLGALVWPGWFLGAGSPDTVANQAVAAFAARDVNALNAVTCVGADGKPTSQIPADALGEVAGATADGPPVLTIDTEARAPMTLTLSAQGQTQSLPSEIVLGQNDHAWCVVGLSQRQQ